MRQADKQVDGFELEEAEERRRESELVSEDEEELHDLDGKPEHERDQERSATVVGAMQMILAGEHIVLDELGLDRRELRALEALETAVDGRDREHDAFVYAEDRSTLLEQALAVLQPDLVGLEQDGGAPYLQLVNDVAVLRDQLHQLEEAQEEAESHRDAGAKGEASDTDDKPTPDADTSLTGPERKVAKPATSLTGADRNPEPKPASSLTGAERKADPKPPTTLGDPKEIAAAAKPWWKQK